VVHELEQLANTRNDKGSLTRQGRIGFRALQEILELNRSADLTGISLMIVGAANPVFDARVELKGLREDFSRVRHLINSTQKAAMSPASDEGDENTNGTAARQHNSRGSKRSSSSCDMMIRAQYKEFLRQIDFHKGAFFLTADKSNAAMARAEGLQAIYYKQPHHTYVIDRDRALEMQQVKCRVQFIVGVQTTRCGFMHL